MKLRLWAATALTCMAIQLSAQVSFGEPTKINDDWQFKNKDYSDEFNSKPDNENWRTVNLLHDWSVEEPHSPDVASCTGYLPGGIGWYKKAARPEYLAWKMEICRTWLITEKIPFAYITGV